MKHIALAAAAAAAALPGALAAATVGFSEIACTAAGAFTSADAAWSIHAPDGVCLRVPHTNGASGERGPARETEQGRGARMLRHARGNLCNLCYRALILA
jgi:hypothetical protein